MRMFRKKKDSGTVIDIFTVCVAVLAITIAVLGYLEVMQVVSKKDDVNQISRKYILKMETEGYLSSTERNNLIYDLQSAGLTNIDLTGTTMSDVGYGNAIYLVIQGTLESSKPENAGSGLFTFSFVNQSYEIYESRMSTAKN